MRPTQKTRKSNTSAFLRDLLTFDRLLTGPVLHLIYWAGLGVIALLGFSIIGASVGLAVRDAPTGLLLAFPVLISGLLVMAALVLLWRAFCEFYVAIFRISEDLRAIRQASVPAQAPSEEI